MTESKSPNAKSLRDTAQSSHPGNSNLDPSAHLMQTWHQASQLPESTNYSNFGELESILETERKNFRLAMGFPFASLSEALVEDIRVRFTGRKSPLQDLLKSLRNLTLEERKGAGARINDLKTEIEGELASFLKEYQLAAENAKLASENDDISLPLPEISIGSRHPVSATVNELLDPLRRMGFVVIDGPEIDTDFFNFEALNIPKDHPARDMQDTFFLASEWVLRTHTSSVQSHAMIERGVPLRVACPGYCYRKEFDMTHVPTFRQIEGLVVDKGIHFGHLRSVLTTFFSEVFGRPVKLRLRSSYFPFTEPSAEMDVECQQCFGSGCRTCKQTGWMEMGGCGLVNRAVLVACGIDPNVYSGFAFGMGVDRIALNKHGVSDLRALYEGDVSFLKDFRL